MSRYRNKLSRDWSAICAESRRKRREAGLCIWGCGNPPYMPSGLCRECAAKARLRSRDRYFRNKELNQQPKQ